MYFYFFFVLLFAKSVEPYSTCDRSKWNAAENTFNTLSNELMDLDKKVQDTCKQFKYTAREIFGANSYRLKIYLPEFTLATFVVKIKHRVIYINGHHPRTGPNICDLTYVDIKVLPEFVNTHGAAWTYNNGMLTVAFPYAHKISDYDSSCSNQYIDETLIQPRRGFPNEKIFT